MLTCFEAFEHFVDPVTELEKLLKTSQNILLSTEFYPEPLPNPDEWWYFSMEHGQHVGFFQKKHLSILREISICIFIQMVKIYIYWLKNDFHHQPSSGCPNFQKSLPRCLKHV